MIVRGPGRGTVLPLVFAQTFVGRLDSNQIVVDDAAVSRVHAVIRRDARAVLVEDLDSVSGTFVNGQRLQQPRLLQDGDELVVGAVAFVVTLPSDVS